MESNLIFVVVGVSGVVIGAAIGFSLGAKVAILNAIDSCRKVGAFFYKSTTVRCSTITDEQAVFQPRNESDFHTWPIRRPVDPTLKRRSTDVVGKNPETDLDNMQ